MNRLRSYSWRNIRADLGEEIKELLLNRGWIEEDVKSINEFWRMRLDGFICIFYKSGTLFISYPNDENSKFEEIREVINQNIGKRYILPSKDFLIGFDEVGKGEIIGSIILAGVRFPKNLFDELDIIVDNTDTKRNHKIEYWEEIYRNLEKSKESGLFFLIDKIFPIEIEEKKSLNKILDQRYKRLLEKFTIGIDIGRARIVIDNYGVGKDLIEYLEDLKKKGAEVVIESGSEDKYLETKLASIIAKRERLLELRDIEVYLGSGNVGDKRTIDWLENWYKTYREWPWFVKKSFKTIKRIEEYINVKEGEIL